MTPVTSPRTRPCLIGFGCGANAGLMVDADAPRRMAVVEAALRAGIDFFDTAPLYGRGVSEANLGRALEAAGSDADEVAVYTKVSLSPEDLSDVKGAVLRSLQGSLARLRRGAVAGVTLHNRVATRRDTARHLGAGPLLSVEDVLGRGGVVDGLRELVDAGVVGSLGFTTLGGELPAVEALLDSGAFDYVNAIHGILGPLDDGIGGIEGARAGGAVALGAASGHDVVGLRVFGGGLLFSPGALQAGFVRDIERWCHERGVSLARTALRYALSDPRVTSIVLGFTEVEHVDEARSAALQGPLPPEELEEIGRLRAAARHRARRRRDE